MLWMWNDDPHPPKKKPKPLRFLMVGSDDAFPFYINGPFLGGHVNLFWGGDVSIKGSMVKIS